MTPHDTLRAHWRKTALRSLAAGALGFLVGAAVDGWLYGSLIAAAAGGGCVIGGYSVRRRVAAEMTAAVECAAALGYATGLSHGVLAAVCNYQAAVFPASPGGVTDEERAARRLAAYQFAARNAVPRRVREAAAGALAALDEGGRLASQRAVEELFTAVHRQTSRR
ncbi:hypothetical protein [Streptomyces sp. NPDC058751]|uniref:hypothetical protein n=1 Tax=Streptomyces sp. NPDC058751 TaxID=3346623 RepID=UPI0036BEE357